MGERRNAQGLRVIGATNTSTTVRRPESQNHTHTSRATPNRDLGMETAAPAPTVAGIRRAATPTRASARTSCVAVAAHCSVCVRHGLPPAAYGDRCTGLAGHSTGRRNRLARPARRLRLPVFAAVPRLLRRVPDHEIAHTLNHQPNLVSRELVTPSTGRLVPQVEPSRHLHLLGAVIDTLGAQFGV